MDRNSCEQHTSLKTTQQKNIASDLQIKLTDIRIRYALQMDFLCSVLFLIMSKVSLMEF